MISRANALRSTIRSPLWLTLGIILGICSPGSTGCGPRNGASARELDSTESAGRQAGAAGGIRFSEVAERAGIRYRWEIPGKRPLNILQTIGNGCAFLDFDQDGNLDVLLVGSEPALFQGDGAGGFKDVTPASGLDSIKGQFLGCATGDYDNDGFPDIYLTAYRGGALLHNEMAGFTARRTGAPNSAASSTSSYEPALARRFKDVTRTAGIAPQPWGTAAAFVDADGDGKLELYIGNYVKFGPQTEPQLCEYSGHLSACGPRFYQPERAVLYRNEGGRFRDVSVEWGMRQATGKNLGAAAAVFDDSGRPSLALSNDEMAGDLLLNRGARFENIGAKSGTAYDSTGNVHGGMGVDWGDYDNDGRLDLAVATFQHEAKCIYHNDGGGSFSELSGGLGFAEKTAPFVAFGIKWLDVDNDGFLDLLLSNGHVQDNIAEIDKSTTYRQNTQLFRNAHGELFEEISAGPAFRKPIVGRGLAVGDYDNDGRIDALVVDSEGPPMLLHNESQPAVHWLSVKLEGVKSSRDGLGAIVMAEAGGIKLVRRCGSDGSYMSASDPRVHFGLGSAQTATVTVKWPGGLQSRYPNVRADGVVRIREGDPRPR